MECAGVSACEHRGQPKTTKLFPCAHLVFGLCRASSGNKDFHKRSAIIANIHPRDDASFLQLKKKKTNHQTRKRRARCAGEQGVQACKVCGCKKGAAVGNQHKHGQRHACNTMACCAFPASPRHVLCLLSLST